MRVIYIRRRHLGQVMFTVLIFSLVFGSGYLWANINKAVFMPANAEPIYQGSAGEKKIALTVNVFWGEEYIPQMLDIMKENKVKANFFMGGQWVKKFPDLTKKIAMDGHDLGNHGYSHPHVDQLSIAANIKEIKKTEDLIFNATGKRTVLYAPPYGERGKTVLQASAEAGYRTILWSVDTVDWQRPDPKVIEDRVLKKVHNGAIVLMHPTAPTINALPNIIKGLKDRGYEIVTVSQIIEAIETDNKETTEKTGPERK